MSNLLTFTKMHGTGNDFIVLDCTHTPFNLNSQLIKKLANRNMGVGFDQLLVVENPTNPSMDFKYRIYNADGGEVEQCGNGARCFAVFVTEKGLTNKKNIQVETNTGNIVLTLNDDNNVTVDMGKPILEPKKIPFISNKQNNLYTLAYEQSEVSFSTVSMGNPHAVIIKKSIKDLNIKPVATFLQNHSAFPNSVNVGFMQIESKNKAYLRVYERGAGETLACGSGACAAAVAAINLNLLANTVTIHLLGGNVTINYKKGEHVFLTGPAKTVYEATINLDNL